MEELFFILIAIGQFLFEFFFDVFLVNIISYFTSRNRSTPEPERIALSCFIWLCGGCLLGGLSLIVAKHSFITLPQLRLVNLVFAPLAAAFVSREIARHLAKNNAFIIPNNHFWQAFSFTLGLVLIRFVLAS